MKKLLRFALLGGGVSAVVSAIVGVISAYRLIEPSDAQAFGITPEDFVGFYAVILLAGAAMLLVVWQLKK